MAELTLEQRDLEDTSAERVESGDLRSRRRIDLGRGHFGMVVQAAEKKKSKADLEP
jgi:hypothetical protein